MLKSKGSSSNQQETSLLPWVEKYRPKSMDSISSQEEVVAVLRKTMESKNLPHLLFYGPPGTGKTSTILAVAQELYGPELIKSRVLELNASDERGIDVIREKVKSFAKTTVSQTVPGYPCPPYKIVILDEADSMTTDAQSALRRTMETYSKITRFCLICNYVSRIIDPLMSRCARFRFKPLSDKSISERLEYVSKTEGVICESSSIKALVDVSGGDLRKAIMYLQTASRLHNSEPIPENSIAEIAGVVPNDVIEKVMDSWQTGDIQQIESQAKEIIRSGYSVLQLIGQARYQKKYLKMEKRKMSERISLDPHVTSKQKAQAAQFLGKADKCLGDGADEHLQLLNILASLAATKA
ncbi:hypothetical protein HK096_007348 [Nowakowskiella sp. JEL0078]|nr:hypothetical protein HK096_007348 [Nowakowskiella sp. JEL0078]